MDNLHIYEKVRAVPKEAQKIITAGRLKDMTDINPMWRIKTLTEMFGVCGVGWKYVITRQWIEHGSSNQVSAFVNIDLFVKVDGVWSEAIPGTGGSSYVAQERNGLHTSDECYKMALTDAISVACKALGFGADVYWGNDATKYNKPQPQQPKPEQQQQKAQPSKSEPEKLTDAQLKKIFATVKELGLQADMAKQVIKDRYGVDGTKDMTKANANDFIDYLENYKKTIRGECLNGKQRSNCRENHQGY